MAQEDVLERRERLVFLCLILAQGAHSIEEYVTRLYAVFPPARFVSSLISHHLAVGFLFVNAALVTFGLWCWAVPIRSHWPVAGAIVWFWMLLELGNGIGHLFLALSQRGYFPGRCDSSVPSFLRWLDRSPSGSSSEWIFGLTFLEDQFPPASKP